MNLRSSSGSLSWKDILTDRGLSDHIQEIEHDLQDVDNDELEQWLAKYAQPMTLLSREEQLFEQKVAPGTLHANKNWILDNAFEDAITSLQSSVQNIERQIKILESHKYALQDMQSHHNQTNQLESTRSQRQKLGKDRAQLEYEFDELMGRLHVDLKNDVQKVGNIIDNAHSTAGEALEKDNRVLYDLQKIIPRISLDTEDHLNPETVDTLCGYWINLERQAMKHKIDDTYEIALRSAPKMTNGYDVTEDNAVRAELNELGNEVDGLIALVAEHRYCGLIKRSLTHVRWDAEAESAKWSEYTACVLLYLSAKLEALYERYEHGHARKAALTALQTELNSFMAVTSPPRDARTEASPGGRGLKPLRLVQATYNETQEITSQALKLFNIRGIDGADTYTIQQLLASTVHGRSLANMTKMDDSTQQQTLCVKHSMADQHRSVDSMLEAIFAYSNNVSVDLVGRTNQDALEKLEVLTDALAKDMHTLNVDDIVQRIKSLSE